MIKHMHLERHRYAPELNTLHIGQTNLPCPGVVTLKQAQIHLFSPVMFMRVVRIEVTHEINSSCNRKYARAYYDLTYLKSLINGVKQYHNLSDATFKIKTSLESVPCCITTGKH